MSSAYLIVKSGGLFRFFSISKKVIDIPDARTGKNALVTDSSVFLLKVTEQFHLQIIFGSKVSVAAFAGKRMMAVSVPIKPRYAQPRSGRDHGAISFRVFRPFAQRDEIFRFEGIDAIRVGFQIVEQSDRSRVSSCAASSRESMVQGRFEILLLPPRTGPATPKQAL